MIRSLAAAALLLSACAAAPAPSVGRLYTYVRSNHDGSLPERIYMYRADETRLEVGKVVSRCGNAAFVTADLDLATNQARELVGGRIAADGSQAPFAWLTFEDGALHARVPAMQLDVRTPVEHTPWRMYDFDLADLNAFRAGRPASRSDFSFGVALIWPDGESENPLRYLGQANAHFAAADGDEVRFTVSGALNGEITFDADEGHIIEARFAEPNHTEYENFRLRLQSVEDDGEAAWRNVRLAQWRDCPENTSSVQ